MIFMKHISLFFLFLVFCLTLSAQEPAVEVRAAWLTTNWQLDWPRKGITVAEQKKELEDILDELQKQHFNLILFQVRAQGRTFYRSLVEDKSPYFNASEGFDPLAFAIEACHQRGMECHAWIPAFPMEQIKMTRRGKILEKRPDYYKRSGNAWFLDPGRTETRTRMVLLVREIVSKYDVDGIHLDYIRYSDSKNFNDDDTYRLYGRGQNKDEWRRNNITKIVAEVYDTVKAHKKWVQVSSSPIGKYKPLKKGDGWTAYETVFQDAGLWMKEGKHDLIFPMMYYSGVDFYPYVSQWKETANGRPVIPGLGVYRLEEKEGNWDIDEIDSQIQFARKENVGGQAYFRIGQIADNKKGLKNVIEKYYKHPAKLPPLTWLSDTIPNSPLKFQVFKNEEGQLQLYWEAPNSEGQFTYNIYFSTIDSLDFNKAESLLAANIRGNSYEFDPTVGDFGIYYFVTASDRYHNESHSAESIFFVHSENDY